MNGRVNTLIPKLSLRLIGALALTAFLMAQPVAASVDLDWGGQIKASALASRHDDDTIYGLVGTEPYYDGTGELRLKARAYFDAWGYLETHYEALAAGGDTRRKQSRLARMIPDFRERFLSGDEMTDERRIFDFTARIEEQDDVLIYHRLDRLNLTLQPQWGLICIGRQAVTWGNGLLFNPMDLFNPFAPTDIERDYKIGDDMVLVRLDSFLGGETQVLWVPRRDVADGDAKWDHSSLAIKQHIYIQSLELDVMAARHYEDFITGAGLSGYWGNAAWRTDAVWTFLAPEEDRTGFLSLVANLDYSWVGWQKNFYGYVEVFYNGLGQSDYAAALEDEALYQRLDRGEVFTLGRTYLAGHLTCEIHPLFNVYLSVITNLYDPSGVFQPRAAWDIRQNLRATVGANIAYGAKGSEFGGFELAPSDIVYQSPDSAFIWLTWFF